MSKEVKIGLAIIGVLLVVFGVVLFDRLSGPDLAASGEGAAGADAGDNAEGGAAAGDDADDDAADDDAEDASAETSPTSGADLFASSRLAARAGATQREGRASAKPKPKPKPRLDPPAADDEAEGGLAASEDDGSSYDDYDSYDRRPARRESPGARRNPAGAEQTPDADDEANPLRESAVAAGEAADDEYDPDAEYDPEEEYDPESEYDPEAEVAADALAAEREAAEAAGAAAAATAKSTAAATAHPDEYEVQRGEDLWLISEALFGTDIYARAIYAHNRDQYPNPDAIRTGDVLLIPDAVELERLYPETFPRDAAVAAAEPAEDAEVADEDEYEPVAAGAARPAARRSTDERVYVVREGETIFDVARNELGKARRWVEIYELNRDVVGDDFQSIPVGTELVLPPEDERDLTAGRPRSDSR